MLSSTQPAKSPLRRILPNTTTAARSCPKPRRYSVRKKSICRRILRRTTASVFSLVTNRSFLYSEKQASFERRFLTDKSWLQFVADRDRSVSKNRQLLKETVEFLTKEKEQIHDSNTVEQMIDTPVLRMIRDQPLEAQAAILSYFILDAQLSFVKPEDT